MPLCLGRMAGESIVIKPKLSDEIVIKIVRVSDKFQVKLAITAPSDAVIVREELLMKRNPVGMETLNENVKPD